MEYLIPYFNYPISLDEYKLTQSDSELHLITAYRKSRNHYGSTFLHDEGVPEFWDLEELFEEELDFYNIKLLYINCFSYKIHRREITSELLEAVLIGMKAEFYTMLGEHVNECQNILLEEMI